MEATEQRDFIGRLTALAAVYDKALSPGVLAIYFEALRDLPFEDVIAGLNRIALTAKFFPRPSEIRDAVCGDPHELTERAWQAWKLAAKRVGSYSSLIVRDAALAETLIAMFGGWTDACIAEFSDEMWASKRKEFDRIYRMQRERKLSGARYLPSQAEVHNRQRTEWESYTRVGLLDGEDVRQLGSEEANEMRAELAIQAGAIHQLESTTEDDDKVPV